MKALIEDRDGDVQQFLRRAKDARRPLVWDSKNGLLPMNNDPLSPTAEMPNCLL